jgi:RNA recognition motif-containing protein
MTNKLFIGSLSHSVTSSQLEEYFAKIGKVLSAKVIVDRGFGFVEMENGEDAKKAISELDNTSIDNRAIVVQEASPKK